MSTTSTKSTTSPHDASTRVNEGPRAKEVRAHEHARHRTKERREHALAKERKDKAATVRALGLKTPGKPVRKLSLESWDGEEPEQPPAAAPVPAPTEAPRSTSAFALLTLGELISRPRRPKAKRASSPVPSELSLTFCAELDFEVIPPLRHVIALDDAEDEPWEYVTHASVCDGSAWKGKSYAQAAASAM